MDIPAKFYKLFLDEVKVIYETELKRLKIEPKKNKVAYWSEIGEGKLTVLYNLGIGTTETRHFYLTDKELRNRPGKDIEEYDKVIIEVLKKREIEAPERLLSEIKGLPEKTRLRKEANFVFLKFLEKFHAKELIGNDHFIKSLRGNEEEQLSKSSDNENILSSDFNESLGENINDKADLDKFIRSYYLYLNDRSFSKAFDCWNPLSQKILWDDDLEKFIDRVSCSEKYNDDLNIFNTEIYSNDRGRISYKCKVYYSETLLLYPREIFSQLPNSAFIYPHKLVEHFNSLLEKCDIENGSRYGEVRDILYSIPDLSFTGDELNNQRPISKQELINSAKYKISILPYKALHYPIERLYTVIARKISSAQRWQFMKMESTTGLSPLLKDPYNENQGELLGKVIFTTENIKK